MFTLSKSLRSLLALCFLLCIAVPVQASTSLAASLRGTYKMKSTKVVIGGLNVGARLSNYNLVIGSKGLTVVTATKIKGILKASGIGTGTVVNIKKATTTSASIGASGVFSSSTYTVNITSASGTANLSASGLRIKLNFTGLVNGVPFNGSDTIVLKKS